MCPVTQKHLLTYKQLMFHFWGHPKYLCIQTKWCQPSSKYNFTYL